MGRGDDDEVHDTDVERPLGLHPYPGMDRDRRWAVITGFLGAVPVSYTHLTLPTIYSV